MSQQKLLKKVVKALSKANIDYMVTGSIVSSLQGEPRSSVDIDFIVDIKKPSVKKLLKAFPQPDFYLDEDSIIDAIDTQNMFNLLHVISGLKVDFWILTDEEFDQSRFSRKYVEEIMGVNIYVSSPEDTILKKLYWVKISEGSVKHFNDALRVFEVQYNNLNQKYLEDWAEKLNVQSYLIEIKKQAKML